MAKIGTNEVFTKLKQLVTQQYPRMQAFKMPYCSLFTDPLTRQTIFRAQISYKAKPGDWSVTNAIALIDPETGVITSFKEGYTWSNWV